LIIAILVFHHCCRLVAVAFLNLQGEKGAFHNRHCHTKLAGPLVSYYLHLNALVSRLSHNFPISNLLLCCGLGLIQTLIKGPGVMARDMGHKHIVTFNSNPNQRTTWHGTERLFIPKAGQKRRFGCWVGWPPTAENKRRRGRELSSRV
jgi:hypothetical protein